ncbi:MAG: hypothetical protein ACOX6A_04360 [Atribacter sp.]|uniref:hypothetical protein n=1 Tax=Atribacter sp. TaxID=2847780 RepID=UPI003D9847BF
MFFAAAAVLAIDASTVSAQSPEPDDTVYSRLYAEFARHPHRRVGSENLEASFAALEREFKAAGLNPRRQTFRTLVQETERLSFTYDGKLVEGALMTDNGPAPFVTDGPIEGPVVFVGNGSVLDLEGKDVAGAIAVVDVAKTGVRVPDVFMRGAKAVVLVGDESIDQWRMARVCFTTATLVPRLYLPREKAVAAGLLEADGSRRGAIDARALLKDCEGVNLWVELPAVEGWVGDLKREEVLVLSARLDTHGFTPDCSPELRQAANAALLADVAVSLAESGPLNRHVVAVFFGAHYAGQEGARFFYHAFDMTDAKENNVTLPMRAARYQKEIEWVDEHLGFAASHNVIGARSSIAREMQQRLKRKLIAAVAEQREPLGRLRRELAELKKDDKALNAADQARAATIEAEIAEGDAQRLRWNELRAQLFKGRFDSDDPANVALYDEMMEEVLADLNMRRAEIEQMIEDNRTWIELSKVFDDRDFVAHFDFDFANDKDPWLLSMINAYGLYRNSELGGGAYLRHLHAVSRVYYGDAADGLVGVGENRDWSATLYKPALTPIYKPFSLSVPNQRVVPSAIGSGLGVAGFQMMTVGDSLAHDSLPFADETDLSGLREQMHEVCRAFGNSSEMSLRAPFARERMEDRYLYTDERGGTRGVNFLNYAEGSTDSEGVPENSILQFSGISMTEMLCGQSHLPRTRILANGFVYMPTISRGVATTGWRARTIGIGYAPDGAFERISKEDDATGILVTPNHLFYAHGGLMFSYGYAPDPLGGTLYDPKTIIASKDAPHKTFANYRIANERLEFFADRNDPVKRIGANWRNASWLGAVGVEDGRCRDGQARHGPGHSA